MSLVHQLFLDTLRETQWHDADRLSRFQLPQIERICRHAAMTTVAYAERLRPLFRFGDPAAGKFRFERWRDVPILTRRDLSMNVDAFCANATPEAAGAMRTGTTSGSTGKPLTFRASTLVDISSNCQNERLYEEHDFDLFARFASIRLDREAAYPRGKRSNGWSRSAPSGELGILDLHTPVEQQLAWLKEFRPAHLHIYPSVLRPLVEAAGADGALRFERIMTFSEVLSPRLREAAETAFGCKVVEGYGCNEAGFIAWQCPVRESVMHVASESVFVELLDEQGEPVRQGDLGRVVLTSLHNFAMPLIRYDVGDLAAFGPPCACGRGLPTLSKLAGRTHDVFILPGDRRFVPHAHDLAFFEFIPMRQFQFVQRTLDHFELRYVPKLDGREGDPAGLVAHLEQLLHPDITVSIDSVDVIPRAMSGKHRAFVSHVDAPRSGAFTS